jgi:ubiquinone/menaquinone biosynthesis C-methylase UbiE
LGPGGSILGVDFSAEMLARAMTQHDDPRIQLLEADAGALTPEQTGPVDRVLITLGLTVIPDWEATVRACFRVLRPGGRIAVFDVYAARWVPQTSVVAFMAGADMRRKVWEPVLAQGAAGELTWLEGSPHVHGGRLFVATADAPAAVTRR